MKDREIYFMEQAYAQAEMAYAAGEVPVGAVVVKNDEIIGTGYNRVISISDPTAHAEVVALRAAGQRVQNYRIVDADLYVTLEPCIMCYAALVHARIRNLYYGADDFKGGIFSTEKFFLIKNVFNHTITTKSGIIGGKSSELLKAFFRERRGAGAVERDGLENR